ncbi:MAG: SDR family NAD(P)-dependent oxidoreductase [Chloroflexota bacterium]
MRQTLMGEVAIVTGASAGIGAATARELARRGARVVLAARRVGLLQAEARAITEAGGQAVALPTDVADAAQVAQLVERTKETFGRVDVLVNNAGANWTKPMAQSSAAEITYMLQVNLLSAMLLTRAALQGMLEQRHGAIISVSSICGRVATEPLYSATKYGMRGFSLALRRQLAGSGVSVSLVSPGHIRTAMTNGLRESLAEPEVVAETIAGLIIRPRREVIVPRKYHAIVGLEQVLPDVADLAYRWRHRHDTRLQTRVESGL